MKMLSTFLLINAAVAYAYAAEPVVPVSGSAPPGFNSTSFRLYSPECDKFLVSSFRDCERVMMRGMYPGSWKLTEDGKLTSTNSVLKKCSRKELSVGSQDVLELSSNSASSFIIERIDDAEDVVIFDIEQGGFLQVSDSCDPFIESDESVDMEVDSERLIWRLV